MSTELQSKLARLTNRHTRYEVVALHPTDYRSMLIGYTSRHSLRGLIDMLSHNAASFFKLVGETTCRRENGQLICANGWIVRFTGRTQREAYLNGERPFVASLDSLELLA